MANTVQIVEDCMWVRRDGQFGDIWSTDCGEESVYVDPSDNGFIYCPYCGRSLDYYLDDTE